MVRFHNNYRILKSEPVPKPAKIYKRERMFLHLFIFIDGVKSSSFLKLYAIRCCSKDMLNSKFRYICSTLLLCVGEREEPALPFTRNGLHKMGGQTTSSLSSWWIENHSESISLRSMCYYIYKALVKLWLDHSVLIICAIKCCIHRDLFGDFIPLFKTTLTS